MLLGNLAGMASAALWAVTSLILARCARRMPALTLSSLRLLYGTLFYCVLLLASGNVTALVHLGTGTALALAASAVLSLGLGDTMYIAGMHRIGVSRASPVSVTIYPLLTVVLAWLLLGEALSLQTAVGGLLVIAGTALVVVRSAGSSEHSDKQVPVDVLPATRPGPPTPDIGGATDRSQVQAPPVFGAGGTGVALVLAATVAWAISTVWLRTLTEDANVVIVGAIRVPTTAAFLCGAALSRGMLRLRRYGASDLALVGVAGTVGSGFGTLLYVYALSAVGAGRSSLLNSLSPVFALPLAALFLQERITRLMIFGTLLALGGAWLFVV